MALRVVALFFVVLFAFFAVPGRAEWREATSDHFIIVSGGSEEQLVRLSQRLEALHWLMGQATGVTQPGNAAKVRIYLVDRLGDVHAAMGGESEAAGFYRPGEEGAIAVVPRDQSTFSTTILFHEYAHHFMLQYLNGTFPPWYVEGFAELMSTARFTQPGTISYGYVAEHRALELGYLPWVDVENMMIPGRARNERQQPSYGQYWLATHYFLFSPGARPQLVDYMQRINRGETFEEATAAFTGGLEQLDVALRRYLRRNRFNYQLVPLPEDVMRMPVVRTLRPGEEAIIDDELQAARYMSAEEHVPIAERVARIAARHPDDPAVWLLLARLWRYADRLTEAEAAVDRLLALDARNVRGLVLKGQIMFERRMADGGEMDEAFVRAARAPIVRANRIDPEDQVPLIAYYRSFGMAGQPEPDIAVDGLYKAMLLVPQDDGLRMDVANELIERERWNNAQIILGPIAYSPHRGAFQAHALNLLRWIEGGSQGPAPRYDAPIQAVAVDGAGRVDEDDKKGDDGVADEEEDR